MDLLFLVFWTILFMGGIFLIWRYFIHRNRIYLLMLLNLLFLTGLFSLYPVVLRMSGNG
jgi:hypothetical protein